MDAHDFEPKTADVAALQKAQVVVSNGAGYDAWATKNLTKGTVSVSAAQMVGAMEGDNPHLWFSNDARNAMAQVAGRSLQPHHAGTEEILRRQAFRVEQTGEQGREGDENLQQHA